MARIEWISCWSLFQCVSLENEAPKSDTTFDGGAVASQCQFRILPLPANGTDKMLNAVYVVFVRVHAPLSVYMCSKAYSSVWCLWVEWCVRKGPAIVEMLWWKGEKTVPIALDLPHIYTHTHSLTHKYCTCRETDRQTVK